MTATGPVTEDEARFIISEWGRLHDLQAGLSAFLPLIAGQGFYMQFGAKRWEGYADFEDHQITKRRFFDESHDYHAIQIEVGTERTVARTQMRWQARYRPGRSPKSRLIKADLEHTWEFRRCARTGRAFMQGHIVDSCRFEPGFAPDDQTEYDPHVDPKWKTT